MDLYLWIKALHIIAVISWMAGMLYLPRLYVYHCGVARGSEASEMLKIMERRLMRLIINPAMIASFALGLALVFTLGWETLKTAGWFHAKLLLVLLMGGFHGALSKWRKDFEADRNTKTAKFYRIANEVPTVLMVAIVILAVVKPF